MQIISLSKVRGRSTETFTIRGRDFGRTQGSKIPSINRCRGFPLEVISWAETRLTVRIPNNLRVGNYKVLVYFDSSFRTSSNSVDFWVTAVRVPRTITNLYAVQVRSFKDKYGKGNEWEEWMLANRLRYEGAFNNAHVAPCTLTLFFRYDTEALRYSPPWTGEGEHMAALAAMAEPAYAGYDFRFVFGRDPSPRSPYAQVIAAIPTNNSRISGRDIYLYYETIFNHEFAHIMGLRHHYGSLAEIGSGRHMPPGESGCIMDRNRNQFCSACRTALNIPLDVDNHMLIDEAMREISRRYPF